LRETIGAPLPPAEQARVDRMLIPARQTLAADLATLVWAEGRAMPLDEVIEYALHDVRPG
jgi:hypothetical protein